MDTVPNLSSLASRDHALKYLNEIIIAQSRLAEANFDLDGFMALVVEQIHNLTDATGVVVELVEGDDMVYRAATGTVAAHIGLHLPKKNSISGLCVETKEILRSNDTEKDPRVNLEACRKVQARSLVVCPLFYKGKAVGVIKILSAKPDDFDETDVQTLQLMAGLIGSALAHQISHHTTQKLLSEKTQALADLKQAEEKLKQLAHYDFLTTLPNRSLFTDRLKLTFTQAKRYDKKFAVFFLDIDHFKSINDKLGHAVGDELLKAFAARLKQCVRSTDMPARLGGDEFVVLLDEVTDRDDVIAIAEKIVKKMRQPFQFFDTTVNVSTSLGIAFFDDPKITAEELLEHADQALYKAKEGGRDNYEIYQKTK